jgi:DNA-binding NarL/FixJ family response regulator
VRVVLVDDSPDFLKQAAAFVEELSEADLVGLAQSGHEALELLERVPADLVVVDMAMPGMDGLELTSRLKARHARMLVAIVTLDDSEEYERAAFDAGAEALVSKPAFASVLLKGALALKVQSA